MTIDCGFSGNLFSFDTSYSWGKAVTALAEHPKFKQRQFYMYLQLLHVIMLYMIHVTIKIFKQQCTTTKYYVIFKIMLI